MAIGSHGANRATVAIGPALPWATLRNVTASVGSALACQVATVARPPVINQFLRPCGDLLAVSPIGLDHAREQSAHSCRVRFRNLGILIASPSSIEIALNRNAQSQHEVEECPVRPL